MRPALGDMLWDKFVAHAEAHYKDKFVRAFRAPRLRCVGPPRGGSCPRRFEVDLTSPRAYLTLGELHLDHEQYVLITCNMWLDALAARCHTVTVCGTTASTVELLCHLLFGVCDDTVQVVVRFRCGPADAALHTTATSSTCRTTAGCVTCACDLGGRAYMEAVFQILRYW